MPLISGGIYTTRQAQATVKRLLTFTKERIAYDEMLVDDEFNEYAWIVGRQIMESTAERFEVLRDKQSLLIGRLFSRDYAMVNLQEVDIEKIKASHGEYLGHYYWGRYILITFNVEKREITIYRDPQGLASLYYLPIKGGYLFSSELALLYDAVDEKPELDWNYLSSFVVNGYNATGTTPFKDVAEVPQGQLTMLSVDRRIQSQRFWNAASIKSNVITHTEEFEECLYETYKRCMASWIAGARSLYIQLSGGLDSGSIIAIAKEVRGSCASINAINFYHSTVGSADERAFAKQVAEQCGTALFPVDLLEMLSDFLTERSDRPNEPTTALLGMSLNQEILKRFPLQAQDEILCGQGGDHLFITDPDLESIADFMLQRGIFGLHTQLKELAAYKRIPYIVILRRALQSLLAYKMRRPVFSSHTPRPPSWLVFHAKEMNDLSANHILPQNILPSKHLHIESIENAAMYVDRGWFTQGKMTLNPLLSQPLVELALSMPTYQSYAEGYNRVMFRRALDKHQTGDYIWRRSKGEMSGVLLLAVRAHYDAILSLVTEGKFAQKQLIDVPKLEQALLALRHGKFDESWLAINLLVAEIWLRNWKL